MSGYRRLQSGGPLSIEARAWNALMDQLESFRQAGGNRAAGAVPGARVKVRNETGAALGQYAAVRLTRPVIDFDDNESEFLNDLCIAAETPRADGKETVAILNEPLSTNAIGQATIAGVVQARVEVLSGLEGLAHVKAVDGSGLLTLCRHTDSKVIGQVLWRTPGTSDGGNYKWAVVLLSPFVKGIRFFIGRILDSEQFSTQWRFSWDEMAVQTYGGPPSALAGGQSGSKDGPYPAVELNNQPVPNGTNVWMAQVYGEPPQILFEQTAAGDGSSTPSAFQLAIANVRTGNLTLKLAGYETAPFAFDASAATIKAALEAASSLTLSTFDGAGTLVSPWTFEVTTDNENYNAEVGDTDDLRGEDTFAFEYSKGDGGDQDVDCCGARTPTGAIADVSGGLVFDCFGVVGAYNASGVWFSPYGVADPEETFPDSTWQGVDRGACVEVECCPDRSMPSILSLTFGYTSDAPGLVGPLIDPVTVSLVYDANHPFDDSGPYTTGAWRGVVEVCEDTWEFRLKCINDGGWVYKLKVYLNGSYSIFLQGAAGTWSVDTPDVYQCDPFQLGPKSWTGGIVNTACDAAYDGMILRIVVEEP